MGETAWERVLLHAGVAKTDGGLWLLPEALKRVFSFFFLLFCKTLTQKKKKKMVLEVYPVEYSETLERPQVMDDTKERGKSFLVRILEARHLTPKNANGLSDPYVVLKMPFQRTQMSSVKGKTVDPRWNEDFVFTFDPHRTLVLAVRNNDFFFRSQEIGRARIDLRYYRDYTEPVWVPLVNKHDKKTKERGGLLIQIVLNNGGDGVAPRTAPAEKEKLVKTWKELAPELQTGDIVLFESRGIPSKGIRWYTKSQWSHAGMVVLPRDIDELDVGNVILVFESHPNVRDRKDYRGEVKKGVQLGTLLSKVELVSYKRISVRKLILQRTPAMLAALKQFIQETRNVGYIRSIPEMIKSGGTGRWGVNDYNPNAMHCTGLVAEVYIRWGLLTGQVASSNYSPFDFEALSVERGYLTDEIEIFRIYNPITRTIDLEPADMQTRYTISRALKAFQGGKVYKPSKALRLLKKHPVNKKPGAPTTQDGGAAGGVGGGGVTTDQWATPARSTSEVAFEFETTETLVTDL